MLMSKTVFLLTYDTTALVLFWYFGIVCIGFDKLWLDENLDKHNISFIFDSIFYDTVVKPKWQRCQFYFDRELSNLFVISQHTYYTSRCKTYSVYDITYNMIHSKCYVTPENVTDNRY